MSTADRFTQALAALLPEGFAWPRAAESTLMRVVRGLAGTFAELHDVTGHAIVEWQPHSTHTRLPEWEAATGLPDPCFGAGQPTEARRARLLARLRGAVGAYPDSSPAATGAIEALCASLGLTVQVRYNTPFRVGRDRCGRRLGLLDGRLNIIVQGAGDTFRVGHNRVGDRLVDRPAEAAVLACALERFIPARYELVLTYV